MSDLDWGAVAKGATVGVVVYAVAFAARTALDAKGGLALALFLVVMVGFGCAGWVAASLTSDRRVLHGGLAALAASTIDQAVGLPFRLSTEDGYTVANFLVGFPLACLLAMSCGIGGAYLAISRRAHSQQPGGNPS